MSRQMESKNGEKYPVLIEVRCSPPGSRCKHPEIWDKFKSVSWSNLPKNIKDFQSLLQVELLLEQSGGLPCAYLFSMQNLNKAHLPGSSYFKIYVLNYMI